MGWMSRLIDSIDAKLDRPADQTVLTHTDRDGSERMIEAEDAEQARGLWRFTFKRHGRVIGQTRLRTHYYPCESGPGLCGRTAPR